MGFPKTNYERMQDEVYESDQYQNTLAPSWAYPHLTDKSLIKKPGRHYVFLFWYPCQIDFHIHSVSLWTLAGGSAAVLLRYMVTVGRSENYKHPSRACEISQWGSYVILRYNPLLWHVLWHDCAVRAGFYFLFWRGGGGGGGGGAVRCLEQTRVFQGTFSLLLLVYFNG